MKIISASILILCLLSAARAQQWLRVDSVFNPSGVAVQNFSAPEFADLNGDGHADLLLGNGSSTRVGYFRSVGPALPARYAGDTAMLSSIYSRGGTNSDYPAACDLDSDRDLDLVIGGYNGFLYYQNIGDTIVPQWQRIDTVFAQVNPLIGTDAKPAFADLDGDGDLDLLAGIGESLFGGPPPGITMGFRNIGSRTAPRFVQDDTLVAGIPDVGLNSYPALKDIDGDGDFDLLIGRDLASLVYFKNTGTMTNPVWTSNTTTFAPVEATTYWKNPTFSDLDRDSDFDLLYGTSDGTLFFYENTGTPTLPQFQYNPNYFAVVRIAGNAATASLVDFDNDGDMDLISGDWLGRFQYFRNDGSSGGPRFTKTTASFSSLDVGSYSSPVFVDVDRDGDKDIVSGALDGMVYCYINTGSGFTQNTIIFSGIDVGWRSAPTFVDIDADGDFDMLVGAEDAPLLQFYRNDGGNTFVPDNSLITGVSSVRDGHPTFVDLDRDGDYDLIIGGINGRLLYYLNAGTPTAPAWFRNDAMVSDVVVRQDAAPAFADMDADGRADVIVGEYNGNFSYYRNQIPTSVSNTAPLPKTFALDQNYPNPWNSSTTIRYSLPYSSFVTLSVYNTLGQQVAQLVAEQQSAGYYQVVFHGSGLASGVYLYRLYAADYVVTEKMLLLR